MKKFHQKKKIAIKKKITKDNIGKLKNNKDNIIMNKKIINKENKNSDKEDEENGNSGILYKYKE